MAAISVIGVACGSSSTESKVESKTSAAPATEMNQSTPAETSTPPAPKNNTANQESKKAPSSNSKPEAKPINFIEGKHYVKISPEMQTDSGAGKIEVIELMWLGCPHCYNLEPIMIEYKKTHPDFVEFKQVPAMLNPSWAADAKTYYLAEILDPTGEKELITQIFQAIHQQKRRLRSPDAVMRLFKQFGFTEQQVNDVKNSMAFQTKLKRAQEIGDNSQAQAVPTLIINGKYRTSPYMAGGEENLMKLLKILTDKEHKD